MSQSHLSNNLDKIIQLISIEQVRCLMKQMKIDDNSFNEVTVNDKNNTNGANDAANTSQNSKEIVDQLTKINNTLLLIVDKISAIETDIKLMKEVKQEKCNYDEEHIKLQIEEKDIPSAVEILNNVEDADLDADVVEEDVVEEDVVEEVVVEEDVVEEDVVEEDVVEEVVVEEVVVEEEKEESEVEIEDDEDEEESEVEIEDDETKIQATKEDVKEEDVKEEDVKEEEEEEVFEIEIDDVTYFATHEENGILYEVDKDGDVGKKVGIIKDGEPIFL